MISRQSRSLNRLFARMTRTVHSGGAVTYGAKGKEGGKGDYAKTPKQIVPPMLATYERYLRSVKPLISCDQYCETERIVRELTCPGGKGEILHCLLVDRQKKVDNWLSEWWLWKAYLEYRDPVTIFSSPAQILPKQTFDCDEEVMECVAKIIRATAEFKFNVLDQKGIKQEFAGKDPLDMSQYFKVFGTTRLPAMERDCLKFFPDSDYIIVIHNNHMFKLRLFNKKNQFLSLHQLFTQITRIRMMSMCPGPKIGLLTSDCRDSWAETYEILAEPGCNNYNLETIKKALFTVSIDTVCPNVCVNDLTTSGHQILHGGGSEFNSGNRWNDKCLQIIVGRDGTVGMCYEHSPCEAIVIARLVDFVVPKLKEEISCGKEKYCELPCPEFLDWSMNSEIKCAIKSAAKKLDSFICDLDMHNFKFGGFGKEQIKQWKMSPDSFVQMALQLAFFRIHKYPGAHYETASLRKFHLGRTDAIRSCSIESIRFAQAMLDCECLTPINKLKAMQLALNTHKEYVNAAMNGYGVDRYLLGIRILADINCVDVDEFFQDPGFIKSSHYRIGTSSVPCKEASVMTYVPMVVDGYSACYNIRDKDILFGAMTYSENNAYMWRTAIECSLEDMKNVIEGAKKKPPEKKKKSEPKKAASKKPDPKKSPAPKKKADSKNLEAKTDGSKKSKLSESAAKLSIFASVLRRGEKTLKKE